MSAFTAINLELIDEAPILPAKSYEELVVELKADIISRAPELAQALDLESEFSTKLVEAFAYRLMIMRQEIVDAARGNMLAYAQDASLEHLAALFGVGRQVVSEADLDALPPVPAVFEDDERLRTRTQFALEGFSTAGPRGSYLFWGLSASGRVRDVSVVAPRFESLDLAPELLAQLPDHAIVLGVVDSVGLDNPMPGDVAVTVLAEGGDGTPEPGDIEAVELVLNDEDIRPLTDHPRIRPAQIVPYVVEAVLTFYDGPDSALVMEQSRTAVDAYVLANHRLGHDITISGLHAALHQPGVQQVTLIEPAGHIEINPDQAAYCTNISLSDGGRDV